MKKFLQIFIAMLMIFQASACAPKYGVSEKLHIATTSYALQYFIAEIAGDYAEVVFGLSGNPHNFELTQLDAQNIAKADAFLSIDVGDYTAINRQILQVNANMEVFDLATGIPLIVSTHTHDHEEDDNHNHEEEHDHEEEHGHDHEKNHNHNHGNEHSLTEMDVHIWLDPIRAKTLVENISTALISLDEVNRAEYQANTAILLEKLTVLDEEMRTAFTSITNKHFLVGHAAYGYLADRYGLEQQGINSASDHAENTAQTMIELHEYIDTHQITTIYLEDNIEANSAVNVLIQEKDLTISTLNNIETIITSEPDYFELMCQNIFALTQ